MQIRPSLALVAGAGLALCLAAPLALAQGGPGGGAGGGTYRGPGDTVPHAPPAGPGSPPVNPGPGDTGGPGPGGAPGTPPVGAPPGPPPGMPPGGLPTAPPDEPTTPDSQPPVDDTTSWQLWWHYNRFDYLPLGQSFRVESSGGDYFLGRTSARPAEEAPRSAGGEVAALVRPALLEALQQGGRQELVVYSLQALAKLGDDAGTGQWNFGAAARHYLKDGNESIAEGALLALGISGDRAWSTELVGVLRDTDQGRQLVGRSKVGTRLRAFAAYGLALLAERNPDESYRRGLHRQLAAALPDERPEVQAAVLAAIGHGALPWRDPLPGETDAEQATDLAGQIELVAAFLADRTQAAPARAQAPYALGLLGRNAPEHLRAAAIRALCDHIGPRAPAPTEVQNGAIIALGELGRSHAAEIDATLRQKLETVVNGQTADRLSRFLAMISLARAAGRPGEGEEPLAALEPTRRLLLRQLERNRGMHFAWAALALGVLEETSHERGSMPSAESARALRVALAASRSGDVAGAVAVALGMLRDTESVPMLLELLADTGSPVLRGYAAMALGMIGAEQALEPLRAALPSCVNFPGSLQRVAIGLWLLGDGQAGPMLGGMLMRASSPESQDGIAAALGWIKDPRPVPGLVERMRADQNHLSRAWIAVALGRIADPKPLPWNAALMVSANYDQAPPTLRDPESYRGVLDYP